jgi:hypothetical protein
MGISGITENMNVLRVGRVQYFHLVVLFGEFKLKIIGLLTGSIIFTLAYTIFGFVI